jgi:hypothetical protein
VGKPTVSFLRTLPVTVEDVGPMLAAVAQLEKGRGSEDVQAMLAAERRAARLAVRAWARSTRMARENRGKHQTVGQPRRRSPRGRPRALRGRTSRPRGDPSSPEAGDDDVVAVLHGRLERSS